MNPQEIPTLRLKNQQLMASRCQSAAEVAGHMGAMQAQDYQNALWAVGSRLPAAGIDDISRALNGREIVRTWLMRGTLHFVAAADVRWMLKLLAPRPIAVNASRDSRLGITSAHYARCEKIFTKALSGDRQLTREEMIALMAKDGLPVSGTRGYHILARLALEGFIVCATRTGSSQTFALLDDWVPKKKQMDREAALAELAHRYFGSHGPATVKDFAGWTGLTMSDARDGIGLAGNKLRNEKCEGAEYWFSKDSRILEGADKVAFLLPAFDEFLLGYKDRSAVLEAQHANKIVPGGNGMFLPTIVVGGRVVGTWKRVVKKSGVEIKPGHFAVLKRWEYDAVVAAGENYGKFLGVRVTIAKPGGS